jgi:hypothetical protein
MSLILSGNISNDDDTIQVSKSILAWVGLIGIYSIIKILFLFTTKIIALVRDILSISTKFFNLPNCQIVQGENI